MSVGTLDLKLRASKRALERSRDFLSQIKSCEAQSAALMLTGSGRLFISRRKKMIDFLEGLIYFYWSVILFWIAFGFTLGGIVAGTRFIKWFIDERGR